MLRFIGGPGDGFDDEIRDEEFHDMPFVAGEGPTATLASMPHLRIAERGLAPLRDPAQNPPTAGGRIGLEILRQDGPNAVSAVCSAGVACAVGGCAATHRSMRATSAEQPIEGRDLRGRIVPIDVRAPLQD